MRLSKNDFFASQQIIKHNNKLSTVNRQKFRIKEKIPTVSVEEHWFLPSNISFFSEFRVLLYKKGEKLFKFPFLPNYGHMFLMKPFRGHNEKIREINKLSPKQKFDSTYFVKLARKFSMILTKSCENKISAAAVKSCVGFKQSSWNLSMLHERILQNLLASNQQISM